MLLLYQIVNFVVIYVGHHLKLASIGVLWFCFVEFTRWNFQSHFYRTVPNLTSGFLSFVMHRLVSFQKSR